MIELDRRFWKDKVVLVTGADGFAGYHLCGALNNLGAKVRAFVKPGRLKNIKDINGIQTVCGDVLDYQSLLVATKHVDVLFHAAAITLIPETRAVISNTFAVNSMGTLNVLMTCRENEVKKIVYISTCHVYGKQEKLPITEENIPRPIDIYSASKLAGEHLCTSLVEMFKMDISISRAFNHFGPQQREEFLVPTIITKLVRNKDLKLGNPEPSRDYSYVSDIVNGYLLLAQYGKPNEIYQFCSGVERSVKEIVENIIALGNFRAKIEWNPSIRKVDIPRSYGDYSKATKELGWRPETPFEEGVMKTIEWFRQKIESER